jgi:hypothetical protein
MPAGLAGYVEYPTQELVSGMLSLDQLPQLSTVQGRCILPGQGFAGFSSANISRKDGVRTCAGQQQWQHQPGSDQQTDVFAEQQTPPCCTWHQLMSKAADMTEHRT